MEAIFASRKAQKSRATDEYQLGIFPSRSRSKSFTKPSNLSWFQKYLEIWPMMSAEVKNNMMENKILAVFCGE
jgi:hypothetical protein